MALLAGQVLFVGIISSVVLSLLRLFAPYFFHIRWKMCACVYVCVHVHVHV